jgi:hypothetical protein
MELLDQHPLHLQQQHTVQAMVVGHLVEFIQHHKIVS